MIRAIAAFALLATSSISPVSIANAASSRVASASSSDALVSTSPWWEKVTVTVTNDGKPRDCTFQSSLRPTAEQACEVDSSSQTALASSSGSKDEYTRITFERRFSPGATQETGGDRPGETFLGGQMMALAIDSAGSVKGCKVVASSGSMTPDYGCEQAAAEKFEASVGHPQAPAREGYMTILVYGHAEHVV